MPRSLAIPRYTPGERSPSGRGQTHFARKGFPAPGAPCGEVLRGHAQRNQMLCVDELPFLTADVPGVGGRIKVRPEDFVVDEVPLYAASGQGTHVYFQIEKVGIPTMRAVQEIGRALNVRVHEIGYAGLKDADAVTRQMLSVEHVDPARIERLNASLQPRIKVLSVSRHGNKLRLGHLAGNRFTIKLRDADPGRVGDVDAALAELVRRGVPNYFGPQRFGFRGDTWRIGLAVMRDDYEDAVGWMLGKPGPKDSFRPHQWPFRYIPPIQHHRFR